MLLFSELIEESIHQSEEIEDEFLDEAVSVMRRGAASKRAAFAGASAMGIAKKKNPALFKQYSKFNLMRKHLKAKIMTMYGPMARAQAKRKKF